MSEPTPRFRYAQHKANAKARGVEFDMTFDEWWQIWEPRYHERGRHRGEMVMCRRDDLGAYRPGNVRIDTVEANAAERVVSYSRKVVARDWGNHVRMGWVYGRNDYGMDYFRKREKEEKAHELGLSPIDDECD